MMARGLDDAAIAAGLTRWLLYTSVGVEVVLVSSARLPPAMVRLGWQARPSAGTELQVRRCRGPEWS